MYAADIYFWKRYRINYPFIFNFKQGTELSFQQVCLLATGFAVLALASFVANFNMIIGLKPGELNTFAKLIPLLVVLVRKIGSHFVQMVVNTASKNYFIDKSNRNSVGFFFK